MPENGTETTALADLTTRYTYAARVAMEADMLGFSPDREATLRSREATLAATIAENALGKDSETNKLRHEYGAAIGLIILPPSVRRLHLTAIAHNRVVQARIDFQSGTDNTTVLQARDRYLLLAAGVNASGMEIAQT